MNKARDKKNYASLCLGLWLTGMDYIYCDQSLDHFDSKGLVLTGMKRFLLLATFSYFMVAAQAQTTRLFNGENLDGWTPHGTEKWYVEKGNLVCESGPDKQYGYLSTNAKYKDFILDLKFKQQANGNSGVFIRSGIEGTKINGWQVEVAPKGRALGAFMNLTAGAGS